jgi:hypothetical protein
LASIRSRTEGVNSGRAGPHKVGLWLPYRKDSELITQRWDPSVMRQEVSGGMQLVWRTVMRDHLTIVLFP